MVAVKQQLVLHSSLKLSFSHVCGIILGRCQLGPQLGLSARTPTCGLSLWHGLSSKE